MAIPSLPACLLLPAALLTGCGSPEMRWAYGEREVYCCGAGNVLAVNLDAARADPAARAWSWTVADSPAIARQHRGWFSTLDECKPVLKGRAVLVCSSSQGGVAVIRRSDKQCLFYAGGRGVHSADIVGDQFVVVALATGSDQVRLYRLKDTLPGNSLFTLNLPGAHGVVWDPSRRVVWALGTDVLLKLVVSEGQKLDVLGQWQLPTRGGHDLSAFDKESLAITTWREVYRFDLAQEQFAPLPALAGTGNVKSVSRNPATGEIIYTRGEGGSDFADRIAVVGRQGVELSPRLKLYKARWNAPGSLD